MFNAVRQFVNKHVPMMKFKNIIEGSHGTSKSRSERIMNEGFKLSSGRYGTGAYFWKKSYYYIELAKSWYMQAHHKGVYTEDSNDECAILIVELKCLKRRLLDFEKTDLKDKIAKLAAEKGIEITDNERISGLYDMFIKRLERESRCTFQLYCTRVAPPYRKFFPEYPIRIIGAPECIISRDQSCIQVKEIREVF